MLDDLKKYFENLIYLDEFFWVKIFFWSSHTTELEKW